MRENWQQFISGNESHVNVEPVIFRSWQRSKEYLVSYERITDTGLLPDPQLKERREENELLLRAAQHVLPHLINIFRESHLILLICDPEGYVLHSVGDSIFMNRAQKVMLSPGACWREEVMGTNAIGTAIAEKQPVTILGSGHFVAENHFLNCWAAPIHDFKGEIIGVLDISSSSSNRSRPMLELAVMGARMIEQSLRLFQLQEDKQPKLLGIINHFDPSATKTYTKSSQTRPVPANSFSSTPILAGVQNIAVQRPWLGRSLTTVEAFNKGAKVAASNTSVLLQGESGVGKEVLARYIHGLSPRRNGPFIALNCAALPPSLVQSELFGYADGAFTGAKKGGQPGKVELANGGTLFLDEIGDMPGDSQALLLRVLQEKEVTRIGDTKTRGIDIRVISATHQDLSTMVSSDKFRLDLFYRLKVVSITLPPLRERLDDLWDLVPYFVGKACQSLGKAPVNIADEVYANLFAYNWPGNIRELENCIESMIALADGPIITAADLPPEISHSSLLPGVQQPLMSQLTKQAIIQAMNQSKGKIAPAARLLGIGRSTLYRKLNELGINY